ncbi:DUF2156 domain-containing protein [Micrococcus sp.]|uniref:bifunctional lysylphosphatidylglycerol flippase/synthetase MprF n=1 Tax=Micrococcus sp. TaxID=1271 RepID=UPI002A90D45B|nr:DUF2156 domain-containing protein [Micrococcus sp.]MDY6054666.1 DUF2156 domain-containing protein [Micrococcus sp.]
MGSTAAPPPRPEGAPVEHAAAGPLHRVGRWFRGAPATAVLLAVVALGPLLPGVAPVRLGSLPGTWPTLLTSLPASPAPWAWAAAVASLALIGPPVERVSGSGRFVLRMVLGHLAAVLCVLAITVLVRVADPAWGQVLSRDPVHGPWAGLAVAGLLAMPAWPALWRRRLLTFLVPVTAAAALFSGAPLEATVCVAVAIGGLLSRRAARRAGAAPAPVGSRSERRVLVATAVAAVVVGTVLALGSPHLVGPLAATRWMFAHTGVTADQVARACEDASRVRECARGTYVLTATGPGAVLLAAMPLVLQLVLADGLRRGRRAALVGTVALQGVLAALAVAHVGSVAWTLTLSPVGRSTDAALLARLVAPVLVPVGVIVLVLAHRRLFRARAPQGAFRLLAVAVPAAAAVSVLATVGIGLAVAGQFRPAADAGALAVDGLIALLPTTALTVFTPLALPDGPVARLLVEWPPLLPWLVAAVLLWRGLRPVGADTADDDGRADVVRELAPASATMAWMGTWAGNRLWRSPTHPGAVSYRVHQDVALTVGDPLCAEADLPVVLRQFAEHCVAHCLVPALYSVHPPAAVAADAQGWTSVQVAEEAVIALGAVTFSGKRFQDLRTAQNRAAKEGVSARWTTWAEAGPHLREQIRGISEAWVAEKELPEMGFTLGGLAELDSPAVRLLVAEDGTGRVHGVTSWLPVFDGGTQVGLTLDFMRRADGGFRPVMEFLLARAVLDAQEEGLHLVSLSGAPLARARERSEQDPAGVVDRLLDALGARLEPVYGFRSLHAFKEKFGPDHVPLRLCLPDPADLPRVGAALTRAYLPEMGLGDLVRAGQELCRKGD